MGTRKPRGRRFSTATGWSACNTFPWCGARRRPAMYLLAGIDRSLENAARQVYGRSAARAEFPAAAGRFEHCEPKFFFQTLGIPLRSGRIFDFRDTSRSTDAVVVK